MCISLSFCLFLIHIGMSYSRNIKISSNRLTFYSECQKYIGFYFQAHLKYQGNQLKYQVNHLKYQGNKLIMIKNGENDIIYRPNLLKKKL